MQKLTESAAPTDEPIFYDARCFETLSRVHELFERWISADPIDCINDLEAELGTELAEAIGAKLEQWRYQDAIAHIRKAAATFEQRRPHLVTWLDGFKTLQLIHAIRDAVHPNISFKESIKREDQWLGMSAENPIELMTAVKNSIGIPNSNPSQERSIAHPT